MNTPDDHRRRSRSFRDALEIDFDPVSDRSGKRRRSEVTMPEADPQSAVAADPEPEPGPIDSGGGGGDPPARRSETVMRALWATPWAVFAIAAILAGGAVFAVAIAAVATLCLIELNRIAAAARPFGLVAIGASVALVAAAYWGGQYQMMYVLLAAVPAIMIAAIVRGSVAGATASIALTMLGIVWIGLALAHAVLLRELPAHGAGLLIDVLIATVAADTAAYAGGRLLGRRPLSRTISPNKTVEGLICGIAGGTFAFWAAGLYQDWLPGLDALAIGVVVALLAPLGDLFESLIKRDLGVKDSGTLVGPHGGLLDRLDALLFTLVAGYYLAVAFIY